MTFTGYHSICCLRDCEWCPDCPCHDDETPVGEEDSDYSMVESETSTKRPRQRANAVNPGPRRSLGGSTDV